MIYRHLKPVSSVHSACSADEGTTYHDVGECENGETVYYY